MGKRVQQKPKENISTKENISMVKNSMRRCKTQLTEKAKSEPRENALHTHTSMAVIKRTDQDKCW